MTVKRALVILLLLTFLGSASAQAHQPVTLLDSDTTAAKGPLLVDGTVSFAIRASFAKAGQTRASTNQMCSLAPGIVIKLTFCLC